MIDPRLQSAREWSIEAERVHELTTTLQALADGRLSRGKVSEWASERSSEWLPMRSPTAHCVFESVLAMGDCDYLRDSDVLAYLRWLVEGDGFTADEDPLCWLAPGLTTLAEQVGGVPIHAVVPGLGWHAELHFCAPARGRSFIAASSLERPGPVAIRKRRDDDWAEALIDLFETLAIDERDLVGLAPQIDVERLPQWSLWRHDDNDNYFEVDRFRSYAKAAAQERVFDTRPHKQSYWIEPANDEPG